MYTGYVQKIKILYHLSNIQFSRTDRPLDINYIKTEWILLCLLNTIMAIAAA